jgi:hypothetical protein
MSIGSEPQAQQFEGMIETTFTMWRSWLTMTEGLVRALFRNPLGYSPSTEAINYLARLSEAREGGGNGGMTDAERIESERRAREGRHRGEG